MKEKTKNILKGLGVGALACFGMFAMTGCSIDLSQEQIDKIMYTVDNSDKFMQDTLDLLEKQNQKLDREEAYNKIQLAQNELFINYGNVWNNLKITETLKSAGFERSTTKIWYRTASENVYLNNEDGLEVIYSTSDGINHYNQYDQNDYNGNKTPDASYESYIIQKNCHPVTIQNLIGLNDVTADDIKLVEIDDSGNYTISILNFVNTKSGEEDTTYEITAWIMKYQISAEGKLTQIDINAGIIDATNSNEDDFSPISCSIKIEYGILTDADVKEQLDAAKDYFASQQ